MHSPLVDRPVCSVNQIFWSIETLVLVTWTFWLNRLWQSLTKVSFYFHLEYSSLNSTHKLTLCKLPLGFLSFGCTEPFWITLYASFSLHQSTLRLSFLYLECTEPFGSLSVSSFLLACVFYQSVVVSNTLSPFRFLRFTILQWILSHRVPVCSLKFLNTRHICQKYHQGLKLNWPNIKTTMVHTTWGSSNFLLNHSVYE